MPESRHAGRKVAGILAIVVVIAAIGVGYQFGYVSVGRPAPGPHGPDSTGLNEGSPLAALNGAIRTGDPHAVAFVQRRVTAVPNTPRMPLAEKDAVEFVETLASLRAGFPKFNAVGRATAVTAACQILEKFTVEPTPGQWAETLKPAHDLITACLADSDPMPRYTALAEMSRLWVFIPGRSLSPFEEQTLGDWKAAIHVYVVRCLGASDAHTRTAAVACLGALPIDSAAVAAVAYIEDPSSVDVRKQTLSSFSQRQALLTDEMLFKRLHDSDATIRELASIVLKTRGRTQEQIGLGGLIYSPKPEQRVSVIPLLKNRTDVDPVIWLIELSRDPAETVRIERDRGTGQTPVADRPAQALGDGSHRPLTSRAPGRQQGRAHRRWRNDSRAPPLPGSSSLNPRAN